VAVLPTAVALGLATRRVTQQAEAELSRGLQESVRLVEQYHRTRLEMARERASLVADLPKLKAAVFEGDRRTAEPVARDYHERVRSDVLILADRDGRTLVSLGADGGRLLETVSAPILLGAEAPEVLGHLTLGFALDDAFAARLRALTGSQVAVVEEGRVFASTLPRDRDAAFSRWRQAAGSSASTSAGRSTWPCAPPSAGKATRPSSSSPARGRRLSARCGRCGWPSSPPPSPRCASASS